MRRLVGVLGMMSAMGCYTLAPVAGQPLPNGTVIALGLNDAGRLAVGEQMGSEIAEIEGRLIQKDAIAYVLSVQQVRTLRGATQVWAGERVSVNNAYVTGVSTRAFSRTKTAIVSAAAIGVIALSIKAGLFGNVAGEENRPPPDTSITTKYPRFVKR